ncbi:MAG: hypothetical protein HUJ25_06325 [Crocinitomicaceae bacterium]|nr:hypothetical protein [Crocinitomicaceae bacterium]
MKTLVFSISLLLGLLGHSQPYIELTFSVVDEHTEERLDGVYIELYNNGEVVDSDSTDFFSGSFKAFWLKIDQNYSFVVHKNGYVSKMGEVDTHYDKPDSLPYRIYFPCFVGLFPECEAGDYSFLKTTPLIQLTIGENGEMTWDKEYVRNMQLKVENASHAKISDEQYDKYTKLYYEAQSLMENQYYDEAMAKLNEAKEIIDCSKVQYAIVECNERKDGLYNEDTLRARRIRYEKQGKFTEALELNKRLKKYFPDNTSNEVETRIDYLSMIINAEREFAEEDYSDARYYYNRAVTFLPDATYPNERLKELDVLSKDNKK